MKLITPRRLVMLAIILPVIVLAGVFAPTIGSPLPYENAQAHAGRQFTNALWIGNVTTETRDWEGKQYFDEGIAAYEADLRFGETYTERFRNCQSRAADSYCKAAGDAFTAGFNFAENSTDRVTARKAILKETQRDNWQTDIKQGTIPSYLIRKEGGQF